jgi:hypothetical protein
MHLKVLERSGAYPTPSKRGDPEGRLAYHVPACMHIGNANVKRHLLGGIVDDLLLEFSCFGRVIVY